jgi:hypothetical protein
VDHCQFGYITKLEKNVNEGSRHPFFRGGKLPPKKSKMRGFCQYEITKSEGSKKKGGKIAKFLYLVYSVVAKDIERRLKDVYFIFVV